MDIIDKERINVVKLALAINADVKREIFSQSKQEVLDNMAGDYGKNCFEELSDSQKREVSDAYEALLLSEANNIIHNFVSAFNNAGLQKTAQSFWWSEDRYSKLLTDAQKNDLKDRIQKIFASRKTWPKSPLIDNEETEGVLIEQFMDRFLNKMVPFRDVAYLEDNNVLHVCVSMFLRNYPHLQTQYSNTFIPLQTTREDEAELQLELEPNPFFSDTLQEKTAKKVGLIIQSQALDRSRLTEGNSILVKKITQDRNGEAILPGKYTLVDNPISGDGSLILPMVFTTDVDVYEPNDIVFIEFPNEDLDILS